MGLCPWQANHNRYALYEDRERVPQNLAYPAQVLNGECHQGSGFCNAAELDYELSSNPLVLRLEYKHGIGFAK